MDGRQKINSLPVDSPRSGRQVSQTVALVFEELQEESFHVVVAASDLSLHGLAEVLGRAFLHTACHGTLSAT